MAAFGTSYEKESTILFQKEANVFTLFRSGDNRQMDINQAGWLYLKYVSFGSFGSLYISFSRQLACFKCQTLNGH